MPLIALASGNPFTTGLPDIVPLMSAPEQDAHSAELRFLVDRGTRVEQRQYSTSLYVVYRNGDVYDSAGRLKASGVPFVRPAGGLQAVNRGIEGRGWPIAPWMQPDPGEGHMALYNPETGAYAEMIGATVRPGFVSYGYGGAIADARKTHGMAPKDDPATPLNEAWLGGTAFGLNVMSFTITDHEIRHAVERYKAGDHEHAYIPHVIGYEAYRHHPNQWHYPATKTDSVGTNTANGQLPVPSWGVGGDPNRLGNGRGVIRMGGIVRLDPDVDVRTEIRGDGTAFGDMMARIIARTLQRHGATMTDQTEAGFALLAEHVRHPDGSWDEGSFGYGSGAPWDYGRSWLTPMLHQALSNRWIQFVNTGRNLEVDSGGTAPTGAYRPRR